MKRNKGITLIALVITIIILLILAGISIATLTGENGLLGKANKAKEITKEEGIKEEIKIAYAYVETEAIMNGWDISKKAEELQNELRKEDKTATVTVEGTNLKVNYKGLEVIINEKGQIETDVNTKLTINEFSIKGTKVTNITPPEGFVHVGGTIDEGYVISDEASDKDKGVDANLVGNQFVWVPVEKDQKIIAKVTSGENIKSLVITDPYGDDIVTKNDIGKQYNEQIKPTINGPYRIVVTTESGESEKAFLSVHSLYAFDTYRDLETTEEYVKESGYDNLQDMLKQLKYTTEEEYLYNNRSDNATGYIDAEDYNDKVNANGGFYVGRYEAGDSSATEERTSSSGKTGAVVTKKNQFVYNWITQVDALDKAKAYKPNLSSSLLTGASIDRTVGWLYETKEKTISELLVNARYWGKYDCDNFSGITGLIKTGIFSQTKANNIYDFAGNIREWSTEHYGDIAYGILSVRSDPFDTTYRHISVNRHKLTTLTTNKHKDVGFRLALYL